jgi:hypothetical protein
MSDRVAIIGGSTVGRDHFPYINIAEDFTSSWGPLTEYPFRVDLDHAMRWFYLVRKWQLVMDITYQIVTSGTYDAGGHTANLTVTLEPNVYDADFNSRQPVREADLVSDRRIGYFFNFIMPADDPSSGAGVSGYSNSFPPELGLEFALALFFGVPKYSAGDFVFRFDFAFNWSNVGFISYAELTEEGPLASFFVDDQEVGLSIANEVVGLGTEYNVTAFSASLLPSEFWPYATKPSVDHPDGLPVYDTATGARLRDPLS